MNMPSNESAIASARRRARALRWLVALYAATIAVGAPLAALVGTTGLRLSASYAGESPVAIFAA